MSTNGHSPNKKTITASIQDEGSKSFATISLEKQYDLILLICLLICYHLFIIIIIIYYYY